MTSVLFDESDFEPVGKDDLCCQAPNCVATREELDRLLSAGSSMIRVRVYLCLYCRFEDEDRGAMRGHFREAHDVHGQVEEEDEGGGENYEMDETDIKPTRIRILKETSVEDELGRTEEEVGDGEGDGNPEHGDLEVIAGLSGQCGEEEVKVKKEKATRRRLPLQKQTLKAEKETMREELCEQCGYSTHDKGKMRSHVMAMHEMKRCPMEGCDFTSYLKRDIAEHVQSAEGHR